MHPLLIRQLAKAFGIGPLPASVDRLARAVDAAYAGFDDERRLMDRAMRLASDELMAVNARLRVDLERREKAEAALRYAVSHDDLTGLANRAMLVERLTAAIAAAAGQTPRKEFAVLFLDMDRFKLVNDSLGHAAGDTLLVRLATRLNGLLKPTDTFARLGGDEFVLLLPDASTDALAMQTAAALHEALRTPFYIENTELFASVSIGFAVSGPHYRDASSILRDADAALYRAKRQGPGHCCAFDETMREHAVHNLQIDGDLRRAIDRREFSLVYQPIVCLSTYELTGFEALIRWNHPTRGPVSPAEFIPVAEQAGLMPAIGEWVLTEVCRQCGVWNARFPAMNRVGIAVNLSGVQFAESDLADVVVRAIAGGGMRATQLTLEVTESVLMRETDRVTRAFARLKGLGVQFSIDDFGTGYSSLACLHRFDFDYLKIDRAFVSRVGGPPDAQDIIETVAALGHRLNLGVVAEGMETVAQLDGVIKAGCDRAQGFLFSRPLAPAAVEALLCRPQFARPVGALARTG